MKLKAEFEEEANRKKNQIISNENKLKQREQNFSKQIEKLKRREAELESSTENLNAQMEIIGKRKEEMEKVKKQQISMLEKISNLTADEARDQLVETLKEEAQTKASSLHKGNYGRGAAYPLPSKQRKLLSRLFSELLLSMP